ncbi:hypothetical protein BDZ97DRAFT_1802706 [Flammula alnicola]|nr:hypothetical protein BDZ97DRAFT_1802706 [Flammula alnicola]
MFPDITSPLRSFFRPLLHILGIGSIPQDFMTSSVDLAPKDGTGISVDHWRDIAVKCYLESQESRQCMVVQVRRYKKRNGTQHEYLVAVVEHPTRGTQYLRVERSRSNVEPTGVPVLCENQKNTSPASGEDISRGLWTSWAPRVEGENPEDPEPPSKPERETAVMGSTVSNTISKVGCAYDIIKHWEPAFFDRITEDKIESFDLNNPIPLAHLAILAKTVHDKESFYNLFKSQCYWFADTIAGVIAKQQGISTPKSNPTSDTQRCYDTASGKYHMIRVHTVRPKVVEAVEMAYNKYCEAVDEQLKEILAKEERLRQDAERKDAKIRQLEAETSRDKAEVELLRRQVRELELSRGHS